MRADTYFYALTYKTENSTHVWNTLLSTQGVADSNHAIAITTEKLNARPHMPESVVTSVAGPLPIRRLTDETFDGHNSFKVVVPAPTPTRGDVQTHPVA